MAGGKKTSPRAKPRNYDLGNGIMRFSQSRMYKKRLVYKLKKPGQAPKPKAKRPERMIVKKIGGEKNGGERKVRIARMPKYYPTEDAPKLKKTRKMKPYSQHKRKLRASITPGTVLILVAGRHKGKRVVFLKQLSSGLLLVTGPYKLNGCPLRRINQIYVMATSTKLDISAVDIPSRLTDDYFKRKKEQRKKPGQGDDIFEKKKEEYAVSEERKEDQLKVDKQILEAVRKREDKKFMFGYLGALFSLKNNDYPHKMVL